MKPSVIVVAISLALPGMLAAQTLDLSQLIGKSPIANPISTTTLSQIENSEIVLFAALNVWKKACLGGKLPSTCKVQIASVQVYTRQIPSYQAQLRAFVKSGDQVSAGTIYITIQNLIASSKSIALSGGVNLGAS